MHHHVNVSGIALIILIVIAVIALLLLLIANKRSSIKVKQADANAMLGDAVQRFSDNNDHKRERW